MRITISITHNQWRRDAKTCSRDIMITADDNNVNSHTATIIETHPIRKRKSRGWQLRSMSYAVYVMHCTRSVHELHSPGWWWFFVWYCFRWRRADLAKACTCAELVVPEREKTVNGTTIDGQSLHYVALDWRAQKQMGLTRETRNLCHHWA